MKKVLIMKWSWALGWLIAIYVSLPFVRPVATFLRERNFLRLTLGVFFLVILFIIARYLFQHRRLIKISDIFAMVIILLAYGISFVNITLPEERLHLIQYGVLAFLVFQALCLSVRPLPAYILAFLLTSVAGWGDEGIQYLLPDRYYELKDVWLNCLSAFLGIGVTFIGERISARG